MSMIKIKAFVIHGKQLCFELTEDSERPGLVTFAFETWSGKKATLECLPVLSERYGKLCAIENLRFDELATDSSADAEKREG